MSDKLTPAERALIEAFAGPVKTCPDGAAHGALTQSIWRMTAAEFEEWLRSKWDAPHDPPLTPQIAQQVYWRNVRAKWAA